MKNRIQSIVRVSVPIIILGIALFLFFKEYRKLDSGIGAIEIRLDQPLQSFRPNVYLLDSSEASFDFKIPFPSQKVDELTLLVPFKKKRKLRQFRIYFPPATQTIAIKEILIRTSLDSKISFDELKLNEIQRVNRDNQETLSINILSTIEDSYLESPRFYYPTDTPAIILSVFLALLILFLLFLLVDKTNLFEEWPTFTLSEWSVVAVIVCTFLSQRYFNISLVVSLLVILRNFRIQKFLANKAQLILVCFFALIVIEFLLLSPHEPVKELEKYSLFLVMPVYISCISSNRLLKAFIFSALLIGSCLLAGAFINYSIFKDLEIFTFWNFTRSIHPVYFSYLLAFCLLYSESLTFRYKYLFQSVLFVLLILSGSKLVIIFTICWFIFFVKTRISFIAIPAAVFTVLFFAPIKDRFQSVINLKALSIISEDHIQNHDDPRLNGLTFRIILWQESLKVVKEHGLFFGLGVSKSASNALASNLQARGLVFNREYNGHNQYITTLYKTGVAGLILLIATVIYCLLSGIKAKNSTLIFYCLLMAIALMTESVFERSFGIAFFCISMLLLMNSVPNTAIRKKNSEIVPPKPQHG